MGGGQNRHPIPTFVGWLACWLICGEAMTRETDLGDGHGDDEGDGQGE